MSRDGFRPGSHASFGLRPQSLRTLRALKTPARIQRFIDALAVFIGISELAGGLGVIPPMAANIAPPLTAWAAVGLTTVMMLAESGLTRRLFGAMAGRVAALPVATA